MKKAREKARLKRAEETTEQQCDWQLERAEETTEQHNHQLEQCHMQQEAAQQRETLTESKSRRVTNAATQQATWLNMSTEGTSIRRSADARQQHESRANETIEQQQHRRTANAN